MAWAFGDIRQLYLCDSFLCICLVEAAFWAMTFSFIDGLAPLIGHERLLPFGGEMNWLVFILCCLLLLFCFFCSLLFLIVSFLSSFFHSSSCPSLSRLPFVFVSVLTFLIFFVSFLLPIFFRSSFSARFTSLRVLFFLFVFFCCCPLAKKCVVQCCVHSIVLCKACMYDFGLASTKLIWSVEC